MSKEETPHKWSTEAQTYIHLQLLHARCLITEKLSYLVASLIFAVVALIFSCITICYLSLSLVHLLRNYVGLSAAYALSGFVIILFIVAIYLLRRKLILNPITRFWIKIFFDDDDTPKS